MLACLLLTVAAITSSPAQDDPYKGWTKGEKLGEATLSATDLQVDTGIVVKKEDYFMLEIEGTMTSEQGRAFDAYYQFQDPVNNANMPTYWGAGLKYIRSNNAFTVLPIDSTNKYQPSHRYMTSTYGEGVPLVLQLNNVVRSDNAGTPTDSLVSGAFKIGIYAHYPPGKGPAVKPVQKPSNLTFSLLDPIEFYDVNSATSMKFPMTEPPILGNYARMGNAEPKREIKGAACDGASLVLLRTLSDEAAEVTFTLEPGDGALYPLVGNPYISAGTKSLAVQSIADPSDPSKKKFFAFALYRPPSNWANLTNPKVTLAAQFEKGHGRSTKMLSLVRPPIVLVHGTFDNPLSCYGTRDPADDSPMTMTERLHKAGWEHVTAVDWESTNGSADPSTFRHNQYAVYKNKGGILTALGEARKGGIVAVQADLVCHSQGGVIARVFARGFPLNAPMALNHAHYNDPVACMGLGCTYHNAESFGAGSIHRLITVSTTHMGSDICRLFTLYSQYSAQVSGLETVNGLWLDVFRAGGYAAGSGLFTGGFKDQIPGSEGLTEIGPTPVPSHAIACVSLDEDVINQYGGFYRDRMEMIYDKTPDEALDWCFRKAGQAANADEILAESKRVRSIRLPLDRNPLLAMFRKAVFGNEENDCTVRISSSFGGMTEPYRTRIPGILHGWAPRYTSVQNRVIQILRDEKLVDPNGFPDVYKGLKAMSKTVPATWSSQTLGNATAWGALDTMSNKPVAKPPEEKVERNPEAAEAFVQEGNRLFAERDLEGAKRAFANAIKADPEMTKAYLNLAILFYNEDSYNEAAELEKKAIELDPDNAQAHMQYGSTLSQQGKMAESEAQYKEVLRIDPENFSAWNYMGIRQMRQDKTREAESSFREAMRLNPDNPAFIANVGKALTKQGKWDEGEQFFIRAMRKDPEAPEPYFCMATVEMERKKYEQAAALCELAIDKKPTEGKYHAELAGALLRMGRKEEALASAKKGLELKHKDHWVYKELGLGS